MLNDVIFLTENFFGKKNDINFAMNIKNQYIRKYE